MLICTRFCPNLPDNDGEVSFQIRQASGRHYFFSGFITPRALKDRDFVVLQPGESAEKELDLADYYAVKEAGSYTISGTYKNDHDWSKDGLTAWKGRVHSPAIELLIEPN